MPATLWTTPPHGAGERPLARPCPRARHRWRKRAPSSTPGTGGHDQRHRSGRAEGNRSPDVETTVLENKDVIDIRTRPEHFCPLGPQGDTNPSWCGLSSRARSGSGEKSTMSMLLSGRGGQRFLNQLTSYCLAPRARQGKKGSRRWVVGPALPAVRHHNHALLYGSSLLSNPSCETARPGAASLEGAGGLGRVAGDRGFQNTTC